MDGQENVGVLVKEYIRLFEDYDSEDPETLENALMQSGEWTSRAAEHLLYLAKNYGSFMLRNALAISLALEIADGSLEF